MPLIKLYDSDENDFNKIDIEKISTLDRAELEQYTRMLHGRLMELEREFQNGMPDFNPSNQKTYIYKKKRFRLKKKNIVIHGTRFTGKFQLAELIGISAERDRRTQINRKNGKLGSEIKHPEHEVAKTIIEDKYHAIKHTFISKAARAKFVSDMKLEHPIFKDEKNIEDFIRELEKSEIAGKP